MAARGSEMTRILDTNSSTLLAALSASQRTDFIKALARIVDHLTSEERATNFGSSDRKSVRTNA